MSPVADGHSSPALHRVRRLVGMTAVEQPEEPHLRLFTVDDERLWESRPRLTAEEFALEDVTDEEWEAFYAALTDA